MEEYVGVKWHEFITRKARTDFPDAAVYLKEQQLTLSILFRALGGDPGLRIEPASPRDYYTRRTFLQHVASSHHQVELAWKDGETLRLPERLALFPEKELNRKLYIWLSALASQQSDDFQNWFVDNQRFTASVLAKFVGLCTTYHELANAFVRLRPHPDQLNTDDAIQEKSIQRAILDPGSEGFLPPAKYAPMPVYLWLYPSGANKGDTGGMIADDPDEESSDSKPGKRKSKRKKAERQDSYDKNTGLMVFRLENLFSWTEFVPVDRAGDDTKEEDAESVADDLDVLSLSRDRKAASSSIKFDLDLPSAESDDLILGDGILLPEWDYRSNSYYENYCCLLPTIADDALPAELPQHLRSSAVKLRRQFNNLKPIRSWTNRQVDGDEIDMDAWQDFCSQRSQGEVNSDPRLYRSFSAQIRDFSCLMLADLSLSTDTYINNEQRVIDVIHDSLQLFSEALSATGDRFALYGFSSRRREHVRFNMIKNFNERYGDVVRGRIQSLKPGYYTRMGAAIRQATKVLSSEKSHQRVLLILTDGKPNDLDCYEGRYGIEDTRMAIVEAKRLGLQPFCVTIDDEADEYLPYIFGNNGFVVIKDPKQLPNELPRLYVNLTQ